MLDNETIRQANRNVKIYLKDGDLKQRDPDENIINALRNNSEESLKVADLLNQEDISPLWVIVCSYYAMFYMANAILFKLGYKVGDHNPHKITSDALVVYVRDKLKKRFLEDFDEAKAEAFELGKLSDEIIESLEFERKKRSNFQYDMTYEVKKSKSKTSLNRAKNFVLEIEKLMDKIS